MIKFNEGRFKDKGEARELQDAFTLAVSKDVFTVGINTKYLNNLDADKQAPLKLNELTRLFTLLIENGKGM